MVLDPTTYTLNPNPETRSDIPLVDKHVKAAQILVDKGGDWERRCLTPAPDTRNLTPETRHPKPGVTGSSGGPSPPRARTLFLPPGTCALPRVVSMTRGAGCTHDNNWLYPWQPSGCTHGSWDRRCPPRPAHPLRAPRNLQDRGGGAWLQLAEDELAEEEVLSRGVKSRAGPLPCARQPLEAAAPPMAPMAPMPMAHATRCPRARSH